MRMHPGATWRDCADILVRDLAGDSRLIRRKFAAELFSRRGFRGARNAASGPTLASEAFGVGFEVPGRFEGCEWGRRCLYRTILEQTSNKGRSESKTPEI